MKSEEDLAILLGSGEMRTGAGGAAAGAIPAAWRRAAEGEVCVGVMTGGDFCAVGGPLRGK